MKIFKNKLKNIVYGVQIVRAIISGAHATLISYELSIIFFYYIEHFITLETYISFKLNEYSISECYECIIIIIIIVIYNHLCGMVSRHCRMPCRMQLDMCVRVCYPAFIPRGEMLSKRE